MLIFEAIDTLKGIRYSLQENVPLFSSQQNPKLRLMLQSVMMEIEALETYRAMTISQGQHLAKLVIDLLQTDGEVYKEVAAIILNKLACFMPESLEGLYFEFLSWHFGAKYGSIFRLADPLTRDQILLLYEQEGKNTFYDWPQLIAALAWIGDSVAQAHLHHWQREDLRQKLLFSGSLEQVLCEAGWEWSENGKRRDLYYQTCLALIPREEASVKAEGVVKVIVPQKSRCGSCGRHLITIFDINLQDPAIAFLGSQGQRLRIAMCPTCTTLGERVFTDVDENGFSQWSRENGEEPVEPLEDLEDWEDFPRLPSEALVCGSLRKTPYETYRAYRQEGLSQIGGFPEWVQSADYPHCPGCKRRMMFIGQLSVIDLIEDAEGMIYAFLCIECGKAATGYQQT